MILVALITLVTLIVRSHRRGQSWPMAMLLGVKRYLLTMVMIAGVLVVLAVGVGTLRAILQPVADVALDLFPEGQPPASQARHAPEPAPTMVPADISEPLPTPTPRVVKMAYFAGTPQVVSTPMPTSLRMVVVPSSTPPPATPPPATLPTATPAAARIGCDPAYPDAGTCIPPGPPFEQGCAITEERRFTVLPPDPQGMDRDGDGIGCEPVA